MELIMIQAEMEVLSRAGDPRYRNTVMVPPGPPRTMEPASGASPAQPQAADEDIEPRGAVLLSLHGKGPVGSAERCFSACTAASALPVVAGAAR